MIALFEPSVRRTRSEFETESNFDSEPPLESRGQLHRWVLSRLRSKPYMTRVSIDCAGRVDLTAPVRLIPIDDEFQLLSKQVTDVDGLEISKSNIVIEHRELFRHPDAVLVLQLHDGSRVPVRVRFTWTRFRGPGKYQSGGKFVVGPLEKGVGNRCGLQRQAAN